MSKHLFRRSLGLMLAALLTLSALPVTALAAETGNTDFTLMELVATDVTLDETVFEYTGQEIRPNVTVRVQDRLLTLDQDYTLEYENNIEVGEAKVIVTGIATAAPSYGYTGTVEVPFFINEKESETPEEPEFTLIGLKGTDVTIDGTSFPYTGQPIEPAVTVTVEGQVLTAGRDYSVEYINNLLPGTGTVIVRGIATASETVGYTGEVRIDFTIEAIPEEKPEEKPEEYPLVEIRQEHVTINGKEFVYTGEAIEPEITVTIDGKVLTAGKDYSLKYENNVEIGTGKAIISGIATATENGGYTGTVEVKFTIRPITAEEYPLVELKAEHVSMEAKKFYYTGKAIEPKIQVKVDGKILTAGKDYSVKYENNLEIGTASVTVSGIATATEHGGYTGDVKLTFDIVPNYQITKGNGANWYQESTKNLSFTANGQYEDFTGVSIDGKRLDTGYYSVSGNTVVTLKNAFLKKLPLGQHTITVHYGDGDASATFTVKEGLDTSNPQTGDEFPLRTLTAVLFISLTGLIGMAFAYRKKLWK